MFFDTSIICKGKVYINGKSQGILCFSDKFAMSLKKEGTSIISVVFNNHKIGVESIINSDGIIIFEDCFNDTMKDIVDRIKIPCVLITKDAACVESVSILVGKKLRSKEGEQVLIDGKKIIKV